jgi:hypothetical protein
MHKQPGRPDLARHGYFADCAPGRVHWSALVRSAGLQMAPRGGATPCGTPLCATPERWFCYQRPGPGDNFHPYPLLRSEVAPVCAHGVVEMESGNAALQDFPRGAATGAVQARQGSGGNMARHSAVNWPSRSGALPPLRCRDPASIRWMWFACDAGGLHAWKQQSKRAANRSVPYPKRVITVSIQRERPLISGAASGNPQPGRASRDIRKAEKVMRITSSAAYYVHYTSCAHSSRRLHRGLSAACSTTTSIHNPISAVDGSLTNGETGWRLHFVNGGARTPYAGQSPFTREKSGRVASGTVRPPDGGISSRPRGRSRPQSAPVSAVS